MHLHLHTKERCMQSCTHVQHLGNDSRLHWNLVLARDYLTKHFTWDRDGLHLQACTCEPRFQISGMTGFFVLKTGKWTEGSVSYACYSSCGWGISFCMCTGACLLSLSKEWLDALCWNLVCDYGSIAFIHAYISYVLLVGYIWTSS